MFDNIYFARNDGKLVNNYDLAKMAYVVNGEIIDPWDLEAVRKFSGSCKGINKEVNPSVKVCLRNGEKVKAMMIYQNRHPGMSLMEAKKAVETMETRMKRRNN